MCQQKQLIANRTSQILYFLPTAMAAFVFSNGDGDGGGGGDGSGDSGADGSGDGGGGCRHNRGGAMGGGGSTVLNQMAS